MVKNHLAGTALLLSLLFLAACGGAKLLKVPLPIENTQPIAGKSELGVVVTLDWVIVPDGPGTWARNARWDEYLLRVNNESDHPIRVTEVTVIEPPNSRIYSQSERKQLVKSSKEITRRYKKSGIEISAGAGSGRVSFLTFSTATGVVGASAYAGATGAAVGATFLLAPVLAVGGISRGVNHSKISSQIEQRQTNLPIEVPAGDELILDFFYPTVPSPSAVEFVYSDVNGEHIIVVDTSAVLDGLHIVEPNE